MSKEVYRAVNKYINFTKGDEELMYTKAYDQPGKAKAAATRYRNQYRWFGRSEDRKPDGKAIYYVSKSDYNSIFEYVDTWVERAVEWERI